MSEDSVHSSAAGPAGASADGAPPVPGRRRLFTYAGLGLFAAAAQVILFRRFFEVFEGHEFGLGCFYATWLLWVAAGAWAGRRASGVLSRAPGTFDLLPLIYLPAFVAQWWLVDRARAIAGVPPVELFPFLDMAPVALLVNAPVSLFTGLLFTLACASAPRDSGGVSRVYAWEAAGAFAGGLAVVGLLAAGMTEERVALLAAAALSGFLAAGAGRVSFRMTAGAAAAVLVLAAGFGADAQWTRANDRSVWRRLLGGDESPEGRFVTPQAVYRYGRQGESWIVLSRESVCEALPSEERSAQVAALHLACAPHARRVLVIGPSAQALCLALLKFDGIEDVVWLHPDPAYPAALRSRLPREFQADPARLHTPAVDPRLFLEREAGRFDIVILNVADPVSLGAARYSSAEFLSLARSRLAEGGVLGLRFSGGENVLGDELARLGASALATMESVFPHTFLCPGGESWLIGTQRDTALWTPRLLGRAFSSLPGAERIGPMEIVSSQFPPGRADFQLGRYRGILASSPPGALVHRDAHPRAVEYGLLFALKQGGVVRSLDLIRNALRPGAVALIFVAGLLSLLRTVRILRARGAGFAALDPSMLAFAAGMAGMTLSVGFMCAYQARYGELFLHAGLFSALYMLGLFFGTSVARRGTAGAAGMFAFPAATWLLLTGLAAAAAFTLASWSRGAFALAFFLAGCGGGLPIPPVARLMRDAGLTDPAAGARIEGFDHLGAAAGGLAAGLWLLPALGLSAMLTLAAVLACAALPVMAVLARGAPGPGSDDRTDRGARRAGYVLAVVALTALVFSAARRAEQRQGRPDPLDELARQMCGERSLHPLRAVGPEGSSPRFLGTEPSIAASDEFVWSTPGWAPVTMGFGGPIEMALRIARDGRILDYRMQNLRETPSYFAGLKRWMESLKGRSVFAPLPDPPIDAVSGATLSARAVAQTLSSAGPSFAARVLSREVAGRTPGRRTYREVAALGLALVLAGALRRRGNRRLRAAFLLAVVGVFGVWLNVQYSMVQLHAALHPPWARPELSLGFVLLAGVPLAVLLFGNMYCGWLCPFGALQELVGELRPVRWVTEPGLAARRWARYVKFLVLFLAVMLWAFRPDAALYETDPLTGFFDRSWGRLFMAGVVILALSFFFRRFWCRYLCPVGAFLSVLGSVHVFRRFWPPVVPAWCDLGVRSQADLDCLSCNRCRHVTGPPPGGRRWARSALAAAVLAAAGWMLGGFLTRIPAASGSRAASFPTAASGAAATAAASRATVLPADSLRRIREQQEQGRLSRHEAKYYHKATEAERGVLPSAPPPEDPRGAAGDGDRGRMSSSNATRDIHAPSTNH